VEVRGPVFEPVDDLDGEDVDTQRDIVCSRADMVDAASHPTSPRAASPGPRISEFDAVYDSLPSTMPPRFRHAAAYRDTQPPSQQLAQQPRLPQLSDGANETPPAAPIVTLLMPSAALQGVIASGKDAPREQDLMQVQCQVLNASRVSA